MKNADDYFRLVVGLDLQTIFTVVKALTDDDVLGNTGIQRGTSKERKKPDYLIDLSCAKNSSVVVFPFQYSSRADRFSAMNSLTCCSKAAVIGGTVSVSKGTVASLPPGRLARGGSIAIFNRGPCLPPGTGRIQTVLSMPVFSELNTAIAYRCSCSSRASIIADNCPGSTPLVSNSRSMSMVATNAPLPDNGVSVPGFGTSIAPPSRGGFIFNCASMFMIHIIANPALFRKVPSGPLQGTISTFPAQPHVPPSPKPFEAMWGDLMSGIRHVRPD